MDSSDLVVMHILQHGEEAGSLLLTYSTEPPDDEKARLLRNKHWNYITHRDRKITLRREDPSNIVAGGFKTGADCNEEGVLISDLPSILPIILPGIETPGQADLDAALEKWNRVIVPGGFQLKVSFRDWEKGIMSHRKSGRAAGSQVEGAIDRVIQKVKGGGGK